MSDLTLAEELRQAAERIRSTPHCATRGEGCECDLMEALASALEVQARRAEAEGVVDTYLLDLASSINTAAEVAR